jgi:uncharacterized zinc-type alcohol dehydrogenase-like protein
MINGYAAYKAKEELKPFSYEDIVLGESEVKIQVTHCGICHSDLHLINNDWMMSSYPFIPGHEVAGLIVEKGSGVSRLNIGDRVGLGWQAGSCHECDDCNAGNENLCSNSSSTCVGRHGGYAEFVVADSAFAIKLPDELESEFAGPLMCGGATVFSPLRRYGVSNGMRVGIIGIGGLGHMALQFANKMGAEVTAISTSNSKKNEAASFGAHNFINSNEDPSFSNHFNKFDLILSTVFADMNWQALVNSLRSNGKLCFIGAPPQNISVNAFTIIMKQKSVTGSVIGSPKMIEDMLNFSAINDVRPVIEKMQMSDVNLALKKVADNTVRYRMVLVNSVM